MSVSSSIRLLPALIFLPLALVSPAEGLTLEEIVTGHLEARGGAARWREAGSLHTQGIYAAFSDYEPFTLVRRPENLYRLDFAVLGEAAIRARDEQGPWWRHPLLQAEPSRLEEGPYKAMIERESLFGPLLLDYAARGLEVALVGESEVEGIPALELTVRFPDGSIEAWFLDAETLLEIAVDSEVHDFTQSPEPMRQRAFYDDFREVAGLVIPFRVDYEFGHRLESMTIEEATVVEATDLAFFSPPLPAPEPPASPESPQSPQSPDDGE